MSPLSRSEAAVVSFGLEAKKHTLRGGARRAKKSPQRRPARAGWRSFGEYFFLEDSRYTSQPENDPRGDGGLQRRNP
jgi:hypothetical protein